ncbi:succinate dehydrogenase cytochrome b subunit [Croceimicrobium hydrocarbonivorans]|uniref:Succinate dehydrogenase cytochrome b subunit n=1 Tax=Croceimicrobium hydrocarbonivorans TaxID=2761580 RepID=A0A7H0VAH4_9FLAO|nr:succinate dehydrogenase cytochrome b subunit [Croceimicrobium hydrocarbonivorans]QNR22722.1 succinate dehydrogenase cytochrome b subunit [Croceimicrobium hydrocarbonivorans]|tara:strand:- start:2036 stop:2725 length:690 start_codon:yes stop_codon:yes gene_type:complete
MAKSGILGSSIAKKYWMSLTGLFLISFLIVHLLGNLQLLDLSVEGQEKFNAYAKFMTTFPLIKIVSYLLYFSILFHAVDGIYLAMQNRKARPERYRSWKPNRNSIWASRNMGLLGTIILVFIVLHMSQFWYVMHWGEIGTDSQGNKNLAAVVIKTYQDGSAGMIMVLLYVLSMAAIAFHLWHGFASAFQTFGLNHKRYTPAIKKLGYAFSVIVPLLYAIIPVFILMAKN